MGKHGIKNTLQNKVFWSIVALFTVCILFICLIWSSNYNSDEPIVENYEFISAEDKIFEGNKVSYDEEITQFIEGHIDYLTDKQLIDLSQIRYNIKHADYLGKYDEWTAKYTELADPIKQQKLDDEEKARQEEEARLAAEAAAAAAAAQAYIQYSTPQGDGVLTRSGGVNTYNGHRETWYSSNVLYHYRTGEWTLGSDGVYRDKDGYVVVASPDGANEQIVDTSLGKGKAYDYCPGGSVDIYTAW